MCMMHKEERLCFINLVEKQILKESTSLQKDGKNYSDVLVENPSENSYFLEVLP